MKNAIAERVNGILKSELISRYYDTIDNASKHIARAITIYNYKRRHSSLNFQIPQDCSYPARSPDKKVEKLLLFTKQKGGNDATNLNSSRGKKIFSLAGWLPKYFLPTHPTTFIINLIQDELS